MVLAIQKANLVEIQSVRFRWYIALCLKQHRVVYFTIWCFQPWDLVCLQMSAMNIMRKMMGGSRGGVLDGSQQHVQDNNLGLMHLRKLFSEFRSPPPGASQKDLKDKLYNMLPLFCKVSIYNPFIYKSPPICKVLGQSFSQNSNYWFLTIVTDISEF